MIALATEVHAEVVLIDEQAGRQEAVRRGLKVAGTLSVLDEADRAGLVVFDDAIAHSIRPPSACRRRYSRRSGKNELVDARVLLQ